MITDLVDLEPLVGQYDPGPIFVGPLLSHSKSSRFHYFYIAGNGNKVYETIELGFVDVESTAQTQRADLVVKLESRFTKVLTFGSLPEMAQAVHARWPNVETARFLAFAELEAKFEPAKVVDEAATEAIVPAKSVNDNLTYAPPWARDQRQHSGLSKDDIASAMLKLKSPAELGDAQRLPVGGDRSSASIIMRRCAVFAAVALTSAVIAWEIVPLSTPHVADKTAPAAVPAPSTSVSPNNDASQAEAALPLSVPNQHVKINEPAPRAAPATVPPSPPSQTQVSPNNDASQAEAAVPLSVPNQHAKINEAAPQAAPAMVPPSPPSQTPVSPNNDASQAEAAVPLSVPNQRAKINDAAPQAAPAMVPPSPPSQTPVSPNNDASQAEAAVPLSVPNQHAKSNEAAPQAAPAMVPPSPPSQTPVSPNNDALQAEAAVPLSVPNQHAKINEAAPQATPATVPPSPPSQISVSPNTNPSQAESAVRPSIPNQHAKINEPVPQAESATVPPSPPSQISVSRNKDPSQAEAGVPPSVPNRLTKTDEPAPPAEPTSTARVPPSQPSQVTSVQTGAAPISGPQRPPAQVGGTATHLDAEEIATLVNRGADYIKSGDLASARLLLRRAAEAGSASAALMLGTTYDPLSIQQLGAIGVVPDVAQARQWYEKAAALGSEAASERLAKLAHSGQ